MVHLAGRARFNGNAVKATFDTFQRYVTAEDSISNVSLDGSLTLNTKMGNDEDGPGASVLGPGVAGGPVLTLEAATDANAVNPDDLVSGTVPGTDFSWDFPALAVNEWHGSWAQVGNAEFTPGFSATRSADGATFDSDGGLADAHGGRDRRTGYGLAGSRRHHRGGE